MFPFAHYLTDSHVQMSTRTPSPMSLKISVDYPWSRRITFPRKFFFCQPRCSNHSSRFFLALTVLFFHVLTVLFFHALTVLIFLLFSVFQLLCLLFDPWVVSVHCFTYFHQYSLYCYLLPSVFSVLLPNSISILCTVTYFRRCFLYCYSIPSGWYTLKIRKLLLCTVFVCFETWFLLQTAGWLGRAGGAVLVIPANLCRWEQWLG